MHLSATELDGTLMLTPVAQRLDASTARVFQQAATEFVQQNRTVVIFNMSHIEFMDSSGLNSLIVVMKSLGDRGRVILFDIQHKVAGIFRLTRMDRVFTICDSQEEALAAATGE